MAVSGAWVSGPVIYSSYPKVQENGGGVIYGARCTFTFAGVESQPASSPVSGTEGVILRAGNTAVNSSQSSVLLVGNSKTCTYDNQLRWSLRPILQQADRLIYNIGILGDCLFCKALIIIAQVNKEQVFG